MQVLLPCVLLLGAFTVHAEGIQEFYAKNKLNIIVGVPPGGSYDLNARLVGRLLQKYLPGHPSPSSRTCPAPIRR